MHIVREVFGKGNDCTKMITYQSKNAEGGKGEELIQQFRTSPQLRIAAGEPKSSVSSAIDISWKNCRV